MLKSIASLLVTVLGAGALASPAIAQTAAQDNIEFGSRTESIQDSLTAGDVEVRVDYQASDELFAGEVNYILYYQGRPQLQEQRSEFMFGEIELQDLNNDNIAEVIVETYSGGAHCCTMHEVYSWNGDEFAYLPLGYADGNGGEFQDIDRDGTVEFLTFDGSFLYQFSAYASSFPPSKILVLTDTGFEDVTRQYPETLRATAWRMYQAFRSFDEDYEVNGVLAGYVAQKALLGEFEEGWKFMLAHYDRTSDWGLELRNSQGEVVESYVDFPTALRAFLTERGYL